MSKIIRGTFHKCIQDSQDYGSDDEHMVSRIFLTIQVDNKKFENLYADIKQTVGSNFETGAIEVSPPNGYKGPLNYNVFRKEAIEYFRSLVGSKGGGIRIAGGVTNIRMRNNLFVQGKEFKMKTEGQDISW